MSPADRPRTRRRHPKTFRGCPWTTIPVMLRESTTRAGLCPPLVWGLQFPVGLGARKPRVSLRTRPKPAPNITSDWLVCYTALPVMGGASVQDGHQQWRLCRRPAFGGGSRGQSPGLHEDSFGLDPGKAKGWSAGHIFG